MRTRRRQERRLRICAGQFPPGPVRCHIRKHRLLSAGSLPAPAPTPSVSTRLGIDRRLLVLRGGVWPDSDGQKVEVSERGCLTDSYFRNLRNCCSHVTISTTHE